MSVSNIRFEGFADRVAVVTGAARGIGRRIADLLVVQGAKTAYLDVRVPDDLGALRENGRALFIRCDVSDDKSVDAAISEVESTLGGVAILINNAGIIETTGLEETELSAWKRTLDINLTGAFICAKRVLPGMRKAGYGRIVCIGSSAGKNGGAVKVAAYAASKAGVMVLAKSIASEYAKYGITSNAVAPSLIETEMMANLGDLKTRIPVGRTGKPDDVAYAVLFLASEDASYVTGEVMDVNGGFLID